MKRVITIFLVLLYSVASIGATATTHLCAGEVKTCKCAKPSKKDICCSHNYKGNTPGWKILTALAVYTITAGPDGKASMSGLEVIPWRFNAQTFESLKGLKDDTPWDSWDLQLTCTNEDFQTYAITPKKGSLWQQDGDLKAKCIAGAAKVKKQARFHIAADLSIADIRELFGLGGNETVAMGGDIDLSGIADGL